MKLKLKSELKIFSEDSKSSINEPFPFTQNNHQIESEDFTSYLDGDTNENITDTLASDCSDDDYLNPNFDQKSQKKSSISSSKIDSVNIKAYERAKNDLEKDLKQFYLKKLQKNNSALVVENHKLVNQFNVFRQSEIKKHEMLSFELNKRESEIEGLKKALAAYKKYVDERK